MKLCEVEPRATEEPETKLKPSVVLPQSKKWVWLSVEMSLSIPQDKASQPGSPGTGVDHLTRCISNGGLK